MGNGLHGRKGKACMHARVSSRALGKGKGLSQERMGAGAWGHMGSWVVSALGPKRGAAGWGRSEGQLRVTANLDPWVPGAGVAGGPRVAAAAVAAQGAPG